MANINCLVKMNLRKLVNYFLIVGLLCLVLGIFTTLVVPKIIESKITEQTRLINNSETFVKWKIPDLPIFIRYFFYNVTNPDEVINGKSPVFHEVGPIVYQERRIKEIDAIDVENDTVTFRQSITYTYRPELSNITEEDVVTAINIPLVGISKQGLSNSLAAGILRDAVHEYMDFHPGEVKIFIRRQIKELLYQGYYDGLLEDLAKLAGSDIFPNHTFAIYIGKNGTFSIPLTIDAGVQNFQNFGKVIEVDGKSAMTEWDDVYCNLVNGSDGSLFPPFVTKNRVIRIFSEDACRSIFMTFQKEIDYYGVKTYRFHLPPEIWASGDSYPDNMCFCEQKNKCNRSGLMDIAPCTKGAPIFASLPHFLYGDQDLRDKSGLLMPSVEQDETYLDIEPVTGLLVAAMKRFQVNVDLFPNKKVKGFRKVPEMVFPVLWGEEFFVSSKERADMLDVKLLKPLKFISTIRWFCFIFGSIFIFLASVCLLIHWNRTQKVEKQAPVKITYINKTLDSK